MSPRLGRPGPRAGSDVATDARLRLPNVRVRVLAVVVGAGLIPPGAADAAIPAPVAPATAVSAGLAASEAASARLRETQHRLTGKTLRGVVEAMASLDGVEAMPERPRAAHLTARSDHLPAAAGRLADAVEAAARILRPLSPSPGRARRAATRMGALFRPAGAPRVDAGDRRRLYTAALTVATALDEELAGLGSVTGADAASEPAECDVVDQLPRLCVGGEGVNHYTKDAALLIDLGGDDVYRNSAGGANPTDGGNGLPVSVNLDLEGDDRYVAEAGIASSPRVAQGAAAAGALGVLVDAAGDDVYSIAVPASASPKESFGAVGQGAAIGGVGILVDSAGSDVYKALSGTAGNSRFYGAVAQGATLGGGGALVDEAGDDSYDVAIVPRRWQSVRLVDELTAYLPRVQARAFGAANDGVAVFSDGGGKDSLSLRATVPPGAVRQVKRQYRSVVEVIPGGSDAVGFGASASGGVGVALFGEGPTTRAVEGGNVLAYGSSYGGNSGFGGLRDAGGDDSYVARAREAAFVTATGWRGVGVVQEVGGNDRYDTQLRFSPLPTKYAIPILYTQAAAGLGGGAFLRDSGGDDEYVLRHHTPAGGLLTVGQAASTAPNGLAVLHDIAGRDTYDAVSTSAQIQTPEQKVIHSVQASVDGSYAFFVDEEEEAEKDRFFTTPEDPPCDGERGGDRWRDCGDGRGEGWTTL